MRSIRNHIVLLMIVLMISVSSHGQETVFTGLKSVQKRADTYFYKENYPKALQLYLSLDRKGKGGAENTLKIARTYYKLNDPMASLQWYQVSRDRGDSISGNDLLYFAESLISQGEYKEAVSLLKTYQAGNDASPELMRKIWRIANIHHLYDDSIYYTVFPTKLNSEYSEFGPVYFNSGIVFLSNKKSYGGVESIDATDHSAFYSLYYARSMSENGLKFKGIEPFGKEFGSKYHMGTVAFFPNQEKMVITRNSNNTSSRESKTTLQMYFVEYKNGSWVETEAFPFNSNIYSVSHPALNSDGNVLYFVSDMPGGKGGKDIYRSSLENGQWSEPENLGSEINTYEDETFPFIYNNNQLYFASRGHGGFGGLDIFKSEIINGKFDEVRNPGYPVNSTLDDFGLVLEPEGTRGYLSSNRLKGKKDDDIFAVEVDLQSYPLLISGILKYKTNEWDESGDIQRLENTEIYLIDNDRNIVVYQTVSDDAARFSLEIPYSSHYKIKIQNQDIGEHVVSLQIPKNKKMHKDHEIVVVEEKFKDQ